MWQDVVDLRDFYHTDLGKVARQLLRARIRAMWPDLHGQSLLGVPNRRGPWSHSDKTPFGFGQPFSTGQATRLLRQHSFTPLRVDRALFFWPFRWRTWLRTAPGWERISLRWLQAFSGVIVIE